MISKLSKFRHKSGFTLAETLIAIGILAVLLALAIPGVISARSQLKMAELDASAKHIFIAAQNRITGLKTSGQLESLNSGAQLEFKPEDYPEELQDWEEAGSSYYYVNQEHGEVLLPAGSIDDVLLNGYYIIEYNKSTSMIYGVFYGEVPFEQEYKNGSIDRSKSNRSTIPLGYYGGNSINPSEVGICPTPEFEIINEDELYIKLPRLTWEVPDKLIFTIEISQNESAKKTYAFYNSDGVGVAGSDPVTYVDGYYKILLDSLADQHHFYQLFKNDENNNWVPGKDLLVTITATDADDRLMPAASEKKVNSLFQSLANGTANIAFGRHLQNLETSISHLDDTVTLNRGSQTENIRWSSSESFVPIINPSMKIYNGNRFTITDLKITNPNNEYAGLFGIVTDSEIKNTNLCNPYITVETASATGALAGKAENSDISSCQVYINKEENETNKEYSDFTLTAGSGYVGGLLGTSINCSVKDSSASMPEIITSSDAAGGLIGYVSGGSVTSSFSDTGYYIGNIDSSEDSFKGGISAPSSGGFVGLAANGADFDNSYALSKFTSPSDSAVHSAGFFHANDDSVKADNCYSAILEGGVTNGFADRGIFNNCIYFSNTMADNVPPVNIFQKTYAEMVSCFSGGRWCESAAETTHPYGCTGEYPFPVLSGLHHFGDWPEDNPVIPDARVLGLVYYEIYSDGSLGLFGFDEDGNVGNSLRNDEEINNTGYGMLLLKDDLQKYYKFEIPGVSIPENESDALKDNLHLLEELPFFDMKISVGEDSLYPFNAYMIDKLSFGTTYNTTGIVHITESTDNSIDSENAKKHEFKINVRFGAAIEPPKLSGIMGTEALPLQLRTQEHYANLSVAEHYNAYYYKQTRNIIMNEEWKSIDIDMKNAVIDGGSSDGYKVYNLKQPLINSDGSNENILQNIYIEGANITSSSGKKNYGILINDSHGSIKNCTISNSSIDAEDGNAAGLAGAANNSTSSLENNTILNSYITSRNNTAAGLIIDGSGAYIAGNTLENSNITSYIGAASGLMDTSSYSSGESISSNNLTNCRITGKTEAVGLIRNSTASVINCKITYSTIDSTDGNASGLIDTTAYNIENTDNILTNCTIIGKTGAVGLIKNSNGSVNNCIITDSIIKSTEGSASGFIETSNGSVNGGNDLTLSNCNIMGEKETVGLIKDSNASVDNCKIKDCSIQSMRGRASGFIETSKGSVNGGSDPTLSNCTITGEMETVGLIKVSNASVYNCKIIDSSIESMRGNASGFVSSTQYTISGGGISNSTIQALNGSAVGIIQTYGNDGSHSLEEIKVTNCQIKGVRAAGFGDTNPGNINNCIVDCSEGNSVINDALEINVSCGIYGNTEAAGFVHTNNGGKIRRCYTNCTVKGGTKAVGFIGANSNSSLIEQCYAICTVIGDTASGFIGSIEYYCTITQCYTNCTVEGNKAAGFVIETKSAITDCYTLGSIHGKTVAAGFMISNLVEPYIIHKYCYTAANVTADTADSYAFAKKDNAVSCFNQCCYLALPGYKDTQSVGDPVIYDNLTITGLNWADRNSIWEQDTSATPYPFPQLKNLPHQGNWPPRL